ncbi:MAG: hypothetical protein ACREN2_08945 [Candidatus Dormibacteria bacterium]
MPVPLAPLVPLAPSSPSGPSSSNADSSSSATANALSIPALNTCIGCTNGSSSFTPASGSTPASSSSTSNADALKVLGLELSGNNGSGKSGTNALLALPANPLVGLALADWITSATSAPSSLERAALLDLNLNPDGSAQNTALETLATLAVLEGKSTTAASCSAGGATGSTDAANLNLLNNPAGVGALAVILLHTGASTNGGSQVYLASINGTQIGNSSQVGGSPINITIPGLTTITLIASPPTGCNGPTQCTSNCSPSQNPCPPGIADIQLPIGTCLGSGFTATQTSNNGPAAPGTSVQSASTSSGSGVGVPSTGIGLGILGFLILGGGLLALGASRVARRWRALA